MAEIAKCQKCGKSIDDTQENSWCLSCGEPLPQSIKAKLPRLAALAAAASDARGGIQGSASVQTKSMSPVTNRYRDAYRVATVLVGLGESLKMIGAVVAGVFIFGSLMFLGGFAPIGIFVAAIAGGLFWIGGVIVAAQGQILMASLDSAVAHSPFLTDSERLQAMGLGTAETVIAPNASAPGPTPRAGDVACQRCGRAITLSDRQVCRDKQLCEDHL